MHILLRIIVRLKLRNVLAGILALTILVLLGIPIFKDYAIRAQISDTINYINQHEAAQLDTTWKTRWAQKSYYAIPRKIHVIWLGTKLPPQYLANLQDLAKLCTSTASGCELNLWTDNASRHINAEALLTLSGMKIRHIESDLLANFNGTDSQYNTQDKLNFLRWVNFEYSKPANYAALSDLFRIEILRQAGGLYLDTDVTLKANAARHFEKHLNALFAAVENNGGFSCNRNAYITNNNIIIASNEPEVAASLQALVRYMIASMNASEDYLQAKKAAVTIQSLTMAQGPNKLAMLAREYFPRQTSGVHISLWTNTHDAAPGLQYMEKLFNCYKNDNSWLDKS